MEKLFRIGLTTALLAIASGLFWLHGVAISAELEMICKNPRRSYVAVFDDKANTFRLKTAGEVTPYQVMRVDNTPEGLVIGGKTVAEGPEFVAYLGEKKRIEFVVDGNTVQTDHCK